MVENLSVLRAATSMTQAMLAEKIGVSRQTVVAIETKKRRLSWSLYLALVCVFEQYENSKKMLESFELFNGEYIMLIGKQ